MQLTRLRFGFVVVAAITAVAGANAAEPPDFERFPALRLAYEVAKTGGTTGAVLNAANEVAVDAFAAGNIAFGEISRTVELTIRRHRVQQGSSLDDLLAADRWARSEAAAIVSGMTRSGGT